MAGSRLLGRPKIAPPHPVAADYPIRCQLPLLSTRGGVAPAVSHTRDCGMVRRSSRRANARERVNRSFGGNMGYQEELRWLRSRAQACQQLDVRAAVLAAIDDELTYLRNEASKPWLARQPEGGDIGTPLKREQ